MEDNLRPNESEIEFLNLAYNRFYDLFDEVMNDSFWEKDGKYRFSREKDGFGVYSEILHYEPIQWVIEAIKKNRPPMEGEIGDKLFRFIRNIIFHFPFFDTWDDVWFNKRLVNCYQENQFIDRFMENSKGRQEIKYRFWEEDKKLMTYLSINFPEAYDENKIYLKDMLSEKEGVKFSFIMIKKIIDTQVEEIG